MKNEKKHQSPAFHNLKVALIFSLLLAAAGCQKTGSELSSSSTSDQSSIEYKIAHDNNFTETNLVSDAEEYNPVYIDNHLVNAWGLSFNDEGQAWVSSADQGVSTVYDADGVTVLPPVNIPFGGDPNGGAPTGNVYNPTTAFVIPGTGEKSEFIFATENGTLAAWNDPAGSDAIIVADRSAFGAVYKGLTMGWNGSSVFLYATNFKQAKIDVFDESFNFVGNSAFNDPNMPAGFAPFNIKSIDGLLYVTYAKQLAPDNMDDDAGPGNGFVDIYNPDGSFVKRFASHGTLNSPWGIDAFPNNHHYILIGNFGNGKISVFDANGTFLKYVKSNGQALVIDGLWALVSPETNLPADQRDRLYFTQGPDGETHGVFGYLKVSQ